jgi:hypothetical protein
MDMRKLISLFAFMLFFPQAYAQTTPAPQNQSPTIVTNADEVTLDLVVHEKGNKPVLDLKPGDIAVTDSGSAVKLSDLRLVTGQSGARLITLVFDRLDPSSAKNAHDIAAKILRMIPANEFSFSVLNVEGRLRLFQGFTSDLGAVGKAVGEATEPGDAIRGDRAKEDLAALPEKNLIAAAQPILLENMSTRTSATSPESCWLRSKSHRRLSKTSTAGPGWPACLHWRTRNASSPAGKS